MSVRDNAEGGLQARSEFLSTTMPRGRRRSLRKRFAKALRNQVGMGVFMAMLIASVTLVVLSR